MARLEKERGESRIPELDGIRGVAILTVVCVHFFEIPHGNGNRLADAGAAILSFGWSGVDLFFVLSGFLIGGILMDNRSASNYFRTFYLRRICRIFPLYYLWVALYYFLPLLLPTGFFGDLSSARKFFHFPKPGCLFFLQNFYTSGIDNFDSFWMDPTWSLAVEEQFYLILPALLWLALPRKPLATLTVLIALAPAFRIFLFLFNSSHPIYVLLPARADTLLLGVLCAHLARQKSSLSWLKSNARALHIALLFFAVGVAYLVSLGYGYSAMKVRNSFEMISYGYSLLALFFCAALLIAITDRTSLLARLLRIPFLRQLGVIAYGIFLTHSAIRVIMLKLILGNEVTEASALSRNLISATALVATWLVATLSWRFFERPIVQWGHSFRYAPIIENHGRVTADCRLPASSESRIAGVR